MSEERLKEIKDSIDFQVDYMKSINFDNVILNEEKELYDEVIRLNNIINELEKYLNNRVASYNDIFDNLEQYNYQYHRGGSDEIDMILDKLKELKENKE